MSQDHQPERFLLARVHGVQHDAPQIRLTTELTADADPRLPLTPGQEVRFALALLPEGQAHRYYGYLMAEPFARVADITGLGGMSLLPKGDRYATSVESGGTRVARLTATVRHDVPAGAFLIPQLRAGIIAFGGTSLSSSTHSVKQYGYRVAPLPAQGRLLRVTPGHRGVLRGLTEGLGERVRLVGVGPAAHGVTAVEPDGAVVYTPFPNRTGYDRFTYALDDGDGRLTRGQVTVFIGDLEAAPGVLGG
ncbi:Ig-like domain-containing protein [Streptomyces sp. S.PB5]|uniref:Ig-like domain-containing protein n=1 Tax=Streptomyces sp. S.PB5 TaxID=3020844 RepID=UPI0025AFF5E1|nr:Ig-like domain-containing protein [Streptomyces sp. S.PB5]MDN3021499.1 Ig-like domain-containing protein [Streptomyces sp. S.PB5]